VPCLAPSLVAILSLIASTWVVYIYNVLYSVEMGELTSGGTIKMKQGERTDNEMNR